jgi:hypothetical protein
MPVLKLPDSFGCDTADKVRVHRRDDGIDNTVILQLDTDCGFAEVEMKLEETTDLIAMLQEVLSYR